MTSPVGHRLPIAAGWTIVQITGPVCPSCLAPWCSQAGRLLARGRILVCDLRPLAAADLAAVDAVARLVLAAQRAGAELRIRAVGTDLALLWEWAGLGGIPAAPAER